MDFPTPYFFIREKNIVRRFVAIIGNLGQRPPGIDPAYDVDTGSGKNGKTCKYL